MLDGASASHHHRADRTRRIGMSHDIGVPGFGLLNNGAQLFPRILQVLDRVRYGGGAAGCHDLDEVGSLAQFIASGLADLGNAIGDARDRTANLLAGEFIGPAKNGAHIPMTARLTERSARDNEARPTNVTFINRPHQACIGAAAIAYRGEASGQHALDDVARLGIHEGGPLFGCAQINAVRDDMHMRVDEAGHQRFATAIDNMRIHEFDRFR